MVEHIVLLKFKDQLTEEQEAETVKRLKELKDEIPGIIYVEAGIDFSGRSQGFSVAAVMQFENKEALEVYGPHPAHQAFITYIKEIGHIETLVVDFNI